MTYHGHIVSKVKDIWLSYIIEATDIYLILLLKWPGSQRLKRLSITDLCSTYDAYVKGKVDGRLPLIRTAAFGLNLRLMQVQDVKYGLLLHLLFIQDRSCVHAACISSLFYDHANPCWICGAQEASNRVWIAIHTLFLIIEVSDQHEKLAQSNLVGTATLFGKCQVATNE